MRLKMIQRHSIVIGLTIIMILTCFFMSFGATSVHNQFVQLQSGNLFEAHSNNTVIPHALEEEQRVIIEQAGIETWEDSPQNRTICSTIVNQTDDEIKGYELGMLAFDKDGNPLDLYWIGIDSSVPHSYFHLYTATDKSILPGEKKEFDWSLMNMHEGETYSNYDNIAYILYAFKNITFSDGAVWDNPEYDTWFDTYGQKKIDVKELQEYYPLNQVI